MLRIGSAVGVLGCVIVTVLLGGQWIHSVNQDRALAQFQQLEIRTADTVAALLDSAVTDAARTLDSVSDASTASARDRMIVDVLARRDRCGEIPCFTGMMIFGADGSVRQSAGQPVPVARFGLDAALEWASQETNAGRVRVVCASSNPSSVVLLTPVPDRGETGLLAAQLSLDSLLARYERAPTDGTATYETLVLSADDTVIFHSHHPYAPLDSVRRRESRCLTCHDSFEHLDRLWAAPRGAIGYRLKGVDQLAAVAPLTVEGERWVVAIRMPRERAVGLLETQMRQLGVIMIVVVSLVVVAGAITWRDGLQRLRAEAQTLHSARLEESHEALTALNAKLERAAHEWRTTADTIDAALIVLEPNGVILRMNVAAAATLPDALPSWLGRPSSRLVEHPPWNMALALVGDAVDRGVVTTDRVRDPANRTWDLWCRPMPDQQRPRVLVMARDVTEVVELQESVRRSETMAQLGAIVSGVAHEVRNPLFAISSLVDAWAVQPHRDSSPFVDALRSEVGRLRTLMVDLLEYGRPPTRTRQVQPLASVVDTAVRACAPEGTARNVRVAVAAANGAGVLMDPRRLERVFINLIQNAIQHAPDGSVVRVETTPGVDAAQVAVTVRDAGRGIAPEDLPRIFTPFFSRRAGGFGLGLAITERIVSEHGGRVSAANDPAGGAVMTVWLPLAAERPVEGARRAET